MIFLSLLAFYNPKMVKDIIFSNDFCFRVFLYHLTWSLCLSDLNILTNRKTSMNEWVNLVEMNREMWFESTNVLNEKWNVKADVNMELYVLPQSNDLKIYVFFINSSLTEDRSLTKTFIGIREGWSSYICILYMNTILCYLIVKQKILFYHFCKMADLLYIKYFIFCCTLKFYVSMEHFLTSMNQR